MAYDTRFGQTPLIQQPDGSFIDPTNGNQQVWELGNSGSFTTSAPGSYDNAEGGSSASLPYVPAVRGGGAWQEYANNNNAYAKEHSVFADSEPGLAGLFGDNWFSRMLDSPSGPIITASLVAGGANWANAGTTEGTVAEGAKEAVTAPNAGTEILTNSGTASNAGEGFLANGGAAGGTGTAYVAPETYGGFSTAGGIAGEHVAGAAWPAAAMGDAVGGAIGASTVTPAAGTAATGATTSAGGNALDIYGSTAGNPGWTNAAEAWGGTPGTTSSLYSDILKMKIDPGMATLGSGIVMSGMGLLKGIGDRSNALELQDAKAKAAQELQAQKLAQIQKGGFTGRLPFTVNKGAVLRRPDGTPVYQNGLISSRLQ